MSTKRKHSRRIHERLSNGQWLNIYFQKYCLTEGIHVWTTGACISDKIREANDWYAGKASGKIDSKQTGRCGLEGLIKALGHILEFAKSLKRNEELQVSWEDGKRKHAYRWLLRHGFRIDEECQKCYHIRNLEYWEPGESYSKKEATP